MSPYAAIRRITIDRSTIEQTLENMRNFGAHGWELLVLWLGHIEGSNEVAHVTTPFVPKQKPISSEDGVGYFVSGETLFELNKALAESGLRLIAQVHSHPTNAYHSEADDRYAIVTAEGGFSLVVPNFGSAPPDPAAWAVYRLKGRYWLEVSERKVSQLFEVTDDR